jgi:hypothetical protein
MEEQLALKKAAANCRYRSSMMKNFFKRKLWYGRQ